MIYGTHYGTRLYKAHSIKKYLFLWYENEVWVREKKNVFTTPSMGGKKWRCYCPCFERPRIRCVLWARVLYYNLNIITRFDLKIQFIFLLLLQLTKKGPIDKTQLFNIIIGVVTPSITNYAIKGSSVFIKVLTKLNKFRLQKDSLYNIKMFN